MRVSKKAVRFEVGIWLDNRGEIHLTATDPELKRLVPNFHTTVSNKKSSKRCHENLYGKLSAALKAADSAAKAT